jgi:hypothetical protein
MSTSKVLLAAAAPLLLAACMQMPAAVPAPLVPAGEVPLVQVGARGVQVYECRAAAGGAPAWTFVAPEAELVDGRGTVIGRHGAGPYWQTIDGSRIVGRVKARADAPQANAIPWLLLDTRNDGTPGRWSPVTSVQRLNTAGGIAPATGCDTASIGRAARAPYSADYVLFVPR